MKILTVCIPTYNRSHFVIEQLRYLKGEFGLFKDEIDIIVADNDSDSKHREKIVAYHGSDPFFELMLNENNLGLINNIYYLSSLCKSKYVWFVGDDDILLNGLAEQVLHILRKNERCYLFINHSAFIDNPRNVVLNTDFSKYESFYISGKDVIMDVFNEYGTINMFITASILPLDCVVAFLRDRKEKLIADPLLFSFYAASHYPLYMIKDVFLLDRYSDVSWNNESRKIYLQYIPSIICELNLYGYDKEQVKYLLVSYFSRMKSMLRFLFSSEFSLRSRVINHLNIVDLVKLCLISFIHIITSRICFHKTNV